jgi:hypothetical protein
MTKYLMVSFSRIKAIVSVDIKNKEVETLQCTNRELCYRLNLLRGRCPRYCQVIVEAKNFVFAKREAKAEIYEVEPEDILDLI